LPRLDSHAWRQESVDLREPKFDPRQRCPSQSCCWRHRRPYSGRPTPSTRPAARYEQQQREGVFACDPPLMSPFGTEWTFKVAALLAKSKSVQRHFQHTNESSQVLLPVVSTPSQSKKLRKVPARGANIAPFPRERTLHFEHLGIGTHCERSTSCAPFETGTTERHLCCPCTNTLPRT
jgi:hypothetical protein